MESDRVTANEGNSNRIVIDAIVIGNNFIVNGIVGWYNDIA